MSTERRDSLQINLQLVELKDFGTSTWYESQAVRTYSVHAPEVRTLWRRVTPKQNMLTPDGRNLKLLIEQARGVKRVVMDARDDKLIITVTRQFGCNWSALETSILGHIVASLGYQQHVLVRCTTRMKIDAKGSRVPLQPARV